MSETTLEQLTTKALAIKVVLTDCDGVLTDGGVYYSARGEHLKRFHMRDGMGVERLRSLLGIETGIVSGEASLSIKRRAQKLGINECHLGIKNKTDQLHRIATQRSLPLAAFAYIGDDVNDLAVLALVGLSACPRDAMPEVREAVDMICQLKGGEGVFREFAEWIIAARLQRTGHSR